MTPLARTARRTSILAVSLALLACASSPEPHGDARGGTAPPPVTSPDARATHDTGSVPVLGGAIESPSPTSAAPTLYDELGGKAGVASLTERFIREIATDERIRGHYRESDMGRFYRMMQAQMCEVTGGGCVYAGDDMRRTHAGMNITPTEFNGIVEALMRAMDAEGLPVAVQNRLLALYAPMREDIIDR